MKLEKIDKMPALLGVLCKSELPSGQLYELECVQTPLDEIFDETYFCVIDDALRQVKVLEYKIDATKSYTGSAERLLYNVKLDVAGKGVGVYNHANGMCEIKLRFYKSEDLFLADIDSAITHSKPFFELLDEVLDRPGIVSSEHFDYAFRYRWADGKVEEILVGLPLPITFDKSGIKLTDEQQVFVDVMFMDNTYRTAYECREAATSKIKIIKF